MRFVDVFHGFRAEGCVDEEGAGDPDLWVEGVSYLEFVWSWEKKKDGDRIANIPAALPSST